MLSWFVVARLDWCAIHNPHAYTFIVSENDEKAKDQVRRVETIHDHFPGWYLERAGAGAQCLHRGVVYDNLSQIRSVPQASGRAAASYVPTMGLSDEAAHQQRFEANWTSIKGTCGPTTQMFVVSSANPSYFQYLMEDRQDGKIGAREKTWFRGLSNGEEHLTHLRRIPAFEAWRNRHNGVDCIRVFYPADPARRSPEWRREAFRGMSRHQILQEHEGDCTARGGKAIFDMLDRGVHVTAGRVRIVALGDSGKSGLIIGGFSDPHGNPVVRRCNLLHAIDHGTTNFCASLWIAVDEDNDWYVFRAYKRQGWLAPANAGAISQLCAGERYAVQVIDAMMGLPDKRGRFEDLYRGYVAPDGSKPLRRLEPVEKGSGSRQEGLDAIGTMLLASLAQLEPDHAYWRDNGYESWQVSDLAEYSQLYLGVDVAEELFTELEKARYDQPKNPDPEMAQPETSLDMMDDLIDCLRYLIRAGGAKYLKKYAQMIGAG
jgi:hypothetical protein